MHYLLADNIWWILAVVLGLGLAAGFGASQAITRRRVRRMQAQLTRSRASLSTANELLNQASTLNDFLSSRLRDGPATRTGDSQLSSRWIEQPEVLEDPPPQPAQANFSSGRR
jgi:hypothetical protein